jgi:drug/metabolite transporter (DMT)-like permease
MNHTAQHHEKLGLWLGLLGVVIFALTLPMTRLATGTADTPQLTPWFVTWARAALAGSLSVIYLLLVRAPWPKASQRGPLYLSLAGNVIGYPLLLGWALRHVTASHAAVITALLPLATAAAAAWLMHQRARLGFWLFAALGSALVALYSVLRAAQMGHGFGLTWADSLLLGAVVAASVGYVAGTKVTASLGAEKVISWVCVMALPITLPGAWLTWPEHAISPAAWIALIYVGVFSMWAGFFAWFRGLSWGGPLRVSQLQLLQPFISILAAVPLLGESLDTMTLVFALLVVATVFLGRRMANTPKSD